MNEMFSELGLMIGYAIAFFVMLPLIFAVIVGAVISTSETFE